MNDYTLESRHLNILVFTHKSELRKYFNLFRVLLGDKCISLKAQRGHKTIETSNALIEFAPPTPSSRARKYHYVLNLTQDENFHYEVAVPISIAHTFLDREGDWSELFEDIE